MEKLKANRKGCRRNVTRQLNRLEELFAEDNKDNVKIAAVTNQLREHLTKLSVNEDCIDELRTEPADEDEYEEREQYMDDGHEWLVRTEQFLQRTTVQTTPTLPTNPTVDTTTQPHTTGLRKPKLPQLEIPTFNGDLESWQRFWEQFGAAIDRSTAIATIDKFVYLHSLLRGPALATIAGLPITEANYESAKRILQERFGNKESIIQKHITKLTSMKKTTKNPQPKELRNTFNQCRQHVWSLEALGMASSTYGMFIVPNILRLFPEEMDVLWMRTTNANEQYDLDRLLDFLNNEIDRKERAYERRKAEGEEDYESERDETTASALPIKHKKQTTNPFCVFCGSNSHWAQDCETIVDIKDRKDKLKSDNRCFICFRKNHKSNECKSKDRLGCRNCNLNNHHRSICETQEHENKSNKPDLNSNTIQTNALRLKTHDIFLQTALAWVVAPDGRKQLTKCLLDTASHRSYVTNDLTNEMKLKTTGIETLTIAGFETDDAQRTKRKRIEVVLQSTNSKTTIKLQALETDNQFDRLPPVPITIQQQYQHLKFADGDETLGQTKIGILIGMDAYNTIVNEETIRLDENLKITKSKLGWILHGSQAGAKITVPRTYHVKTQEDDALLRKFWELESMGIHDDNKAKHSLREEEIMNQFRKTFKIDDNRAIVGLPWRDNKKEMRDNKDIARRRFDHLQRKFEKDKSYKQRYTDAMITYFTDNHVENTDRNEDNSYFIPHHAVCNDSRETTKTRIVFDASSHEKSSKSLNDVLETGPNLNPESIATLLRFRMYKEVMAADGSKAFLQIKLREEDRKATKFWWFRTEEGNGEMKTYNEITTYQFARLPFGLNCSPFLLAATIRHHAQQRKTEYPQLPTAIENGMYVDDFTYGAETVAELRKTHTDMKTLMNEINIPMQKWITNSPELRDEWERVNESTRQQSKILGIGWDNKADEFHLTHANLLDEIQTTTCTKQLLLRTTAKIYDPLGLATPVTIIGKILFQDTWCRGLDWNAILPEDLAQRWQRWIKNLPQLDKIRTTRWVKTINDNDQRKEMHTFCDASERAYGAAIYIRTIKKGQITTQLLTSKCRLAPTKKITLPRLELMAALVGTRLSNYVQEALKIKFHRVTFWSDSTITLHWIKNQPKTWKPFVENRVTEIQKTTEPNQWKHCAGDNNPADHLTRGMDVEELLNSNWWTGPNWIKTDETQWPTEEKNNQEQIEQHANREKRKTTTLTIQIEEDVINAERINDYKKAVRIMGWTLRAIHNVKTTSDKRRGELTANEVRDSEEQWWKIVQKGKFAKEIRTLHNEGNLSKTSTIRKYNPYLDNEGILRIGGRLEEAELSREIKHPIILDGDHHFTRLLIRHEHKRLHHLGTRIILAELRQKFWILRGRRVVKREINDCITCKRLRKITGQQIEAPLPLDRIKLTTPFEITGVDFAGPLYVKENTTKHYIALFTCATTRAIHLELVATMTTEKFLLVLRKFFARRGISNTIYSDNAKTFKRADHELQAVWRRHDDISTFFAHQGVTWKYIVERAAWWGGWWERMVQTVKRCLRKTIGKSNLSREELETVLTEIEATINSRPITYDYSEIEEGEPLTPAHFLVGKRLTEIPMKKITENDDETLSRSWRRKQQILQSFEKRWKKEYLLDLNSFHTVNQPKNGPNFTENDVVLLADENIPQQRWKLGRIKEIKPGRDGKIRSCIITDAKGTEFRRPVQLLHPLELNV